MLLPDNSSVDESFCCLQTEGFLASLPRLHNFLDVGFSKIVKKKPWYCQNRFFFQWAKYIFCHSTLWMQTELPKQPFFSFSKPRSLLFGRTGMEFGHPVHFLTTFYWREWHAIINDLSRFLVPLLISLTLQLLTVQWFSTSCSSPFVLHERILFADILMSIVSWDYERNVVCIVFSWRCREKPGLPKLNGRNWKELSNCRWLTDTVFSFLETDGKHVSQQCSIYFLVTSPTPMTRLWFHKRKLKTRRYIATKCTQTFYVFICLPVSFGQNIFHQPLHCLKNGSRKQSYINHIAASSTFSTHFALFMTSLFSLKPHHLEAIKLRQAIHSSLFGHPRSHLIFFLRDSPCHVETEQH